MMIVFDRAVKAGSINFKFWPLAKFKIDSLSIPDTRLCIFYAFVCKKSALLVQFMMKNIFLIPSDCNMFDRTN